MKLLMRSKTKYHINKPGLSAYLQFPVSLLLFGILLLTAEYGIGQPGNRFQEIMDKGAEAGIAEERMEALISRGQNRGLDADELDRLMEAPISIADRGLPYHPLIKKYMEGMAKGVPPGSIQQVLDNMANGLIRSADLVDPWVTRNEVQQMLERETGGREIDAATRRFRNQVLESTSYALQLGLGEETLSGFLDQLTSEQATERSGMNAIASAIRTLPDLPGAHDSPEMGSRLLVRVLNAGFSAHEIQQLPDAFHSAQFRSQLPAENIARGMERQMERGMPPEHILDNVFKGNVGGGPPGFTPPGLGDTEGEGEGEGRGRGPGRDQGGPPDSPPGQ